MYKKINIKIQAAVLSSVLALSAGMPVYAEDDYSDTEKWYKQCTQVQTTREGVLACQGFQEYQDKKKEELNQSISSFEDSIAELSEDTDRIEKLAKEQKELSESLDAQIQNLQNAIDLTEASIADTKAKIAQKQEEIDQYDDQIKDRMRQEQSQTSTNSIVDLIMGSTSLSDMLRRITGLQRITYSDQEQIEDLNARKEELTGTISGLQDLIDQNQKDADALEEQKKAAEKMQADYEKMVDEYEDKITELEAQKRSAQVDKDAIKDFTINVDLSAQLYDSIPNDKGFINPVPSARVSAGTWAYAGGGLHLGLDLAAPVGTDLLAPAGGLILYASNEQPSTNGYLGNWCGMPYGSGNYIQMLCEVNGTTYSVGFSHLSNEFKVKAGDVVIQGQVLAHTGHSGNSTGPHTHVEIYNLGKMTIKEAVEAFEKTNDFAYGSGWGTANKACEAGNSAPCRERPETLLLKS